MSTQSEPETDVEQPAVELDKTPLPRSFLVEASGPATKRTRVTGDLAESDETTVEIQHRIETLEEFDRFYEARDKRHWKAVVVKTLLTEAAPEGVIYEFDADEWDVVVNGRVKSYRGVVEALGDDELEIGATNPTQARNGDVSLQLANYHIALVHTETMDQDEVFAKLADDCSKEALFGYGATIAKLDAKHGERENLAAYADALLEAVHENGSEN